LGFQLESIIYIQKGEYLSKPIVIGHRGASGYRPENTIEAFKLGIEQGADGIELDVVNTKDSKLIIRHENILSQTTNIAELSRFEELKRDGSVEGQYHLDWYTEDLDLEDIKSLRAIERIPDLRPGSAKFDNEFEIPTLTEVLHSDFLKNKILVIEIKTGSHLTTLRENIGKLVADEVLASPAQSNNLEIYVESFHQDLLHDAKSEFELNGINAKYFFAIDSTKIVDVDLVKLAEEFDGLSIATHMLLSADTWVESCHELGLEVWVYTARAENATTTIEAYYEELIQTGVDGIFADQPDLLRRVLDERG
jgi:glycerophosphoryl diester phosphodiesterase